MVKSRSKKKKPAGPPARKTNAEARTREYLTIAEVEDMIDAAKEVGRHGFRDAILILICYRHALRVSELVDLRWEQFDLDKGRVHINRLKNGDPSVHFLEGNEIRALRKLRRDYPSNDFVFISERQGPLSINAVHKIVARAGIEAGLEISTHPHMLRHGKGFELADRGIDTRAIQGYLGHKNIQHTVRYTQLASGRFKGFGQDLSF